jgi:hypothetical protein
VTLLDADLDAVGVEKYQSHRGEGERKETNTTPLIGEPTDPGSFDAFSLLTDSIAADLSSTATRRAW